VSYFSQQKGRDKGGAATDAGSGTAAAPTKPATPDMVSTFGPGTLITGNIVCDGAAEIFGRVIGDIQALQITVGDGARVEGNITAHDVAINGAFKGVIRSHNVKLRGAAVVDGEIFSKSLTVDENVQFEGLSRRLDKEIELQSSTQAVPSAQPAAASPIPVSQIPASSINGGKPLSVAAGNSGPISPPSTFPQPAV